jgi:hypothetical protein
MKKEASLKLPSPVSQLTFHRKTKVAGVHLLCCSIGPAAGLKLLDYNLAFFQEQWGKLFIFYG